MLAISVCCLGLTATAPDVMMGRARPRIITWLAPVHINHMIGVRWAVVALHMVGLGIIATKIVDQIRLCAAEVIDQIRACGPVGPVIIRDEVIPG